MAKHKKTGKEIDVIGPDRSGSYIYIDENKLRKYITADDFDYMASTNDHMSAKQMNELNQTTGLLRPKKLFFIF